MVFRSHLIRASGQIVHRPTPSNLAIGPPVLASLYIARKRQQRRVRSSVPDGQAPGPRRARPRSNVHAPPFTDRFHTPQARLAERIILKEVATFQRKFFGGEGKMRHRAHRGHRERGWRRGQVPVLGEEGFDSCAFVGGVELGAVGAGASGAAEVTPCV